MSDIGIFTIIALDNYGAVLQGYALQKQLSLMGYGAELVDLRNKDQNDCRLFLKIHSPLDILRNVRQLISYKKNKKRMDLFNSFVEKYMKLSRNYSNSEELTERKLPYKLLLTGSDQTFNLKLPVFKKEFYLGFEKDIPKASYASSFGEFCKSYTDDEKKLIKGWLSEYKFIGIREEQGVEFAKEITDREDIVQNIDPTLLINRKGWEELIDSKENQHGDYLLFYSVLSDKWVVDKVKKIAAGLNLKVIAPHMCNQFEIGAGFERVSAGPAEFLKLIKNARLVLTTSFHATVFSVIFHKNFCSFILEEGNRIGGLLKMCGLEERTISSAENEAEFSEIDFSYADNALEKARSESIAYLYTVLNDIFGG